MAVLSLYCIGKRMQASADIQKAMGRMYNLMGGERTTTKKQFEALARSIDKQVVWAVQRLKYRDFREGDVQHSLASIETAAEGLCYDPVCP